MVLAFQSPLLTHAHAHNDYAHARPLFDALDQGFCSVEADVFLVDGKLLVAHNRNDLKPERSLVNLYLKPLADRVRINRGSVYAEKKPFILLIDIKEKGEEVYQELKNELKPYERLLTYQDGTLHKRAITVILSGDRPIENVLKEKKRFAFIDGRPSDLDGGPDSSVTPLISQDFSEVFGFTLQFPLKPEQHAKLVDMVNKCHAQGRILRFWGTAENPTLWKELRETGVDLIGTDQLAKLREFLVGTPTP